jgi:hypothetical protein
MKLGLKKIISAVLAAAMVLAFAPKAEITVSAAKNVNPYYTYEDSVSGIRFTSDSGMSAEKKLGEYLGKSKFLRYIPYASADVSDYIKHSLKSIYIPYIMDYSDGIVSDILVTSSYVRTSFSYGGKSFDLYYYYGGEGHYSYAKGLYTDKKTSYSPQRYVLSSHTVYSSTSSGVTSYNWLQNGSPFELRVQGRHSDDYYSLCKVYSHKLDIIDNGATFIYTAEELMALSSDAESVVLANDIDMSDIDSWRGIQGFSGYFDGNSHTVYNLTSEKYGLFSSVKSGAEIANVRLYNCNISSECPQVGGIVSVISSDVTDVKISGCAVNGYVGTKYDRSRSSAAGGIVGINNSESAVISNCYSNAVVESAYKAGGIAGINKGIIRDCAFGNFSGTGGFVENTYNTYNTYSGTLYSAGGICAISEGTITNCITGRGAVIAQGDYSGGIVGVLQGSGTVTKCVNMADIFAGTYGYSGCIAGYAFRDTVIRNCYSIKYSDSYSSAKSIGGGNIVNKKTYTVTGDSVSDISSFGGLDSTWYIHSSGCGPVHRITYSYWVDNTPCVYGYLL